MILNKFFILVFIRVTLIVLTAVLLGILLPQLGNGYYYTLLGLLFLIALQALLLVKYVNKTNEDLEKFFSLVHDNDSSVRFPEEVKSSSFSNLTARLNQLNRNIQNVKIENERASQLMKNLVDHVDIGLLSYDNSGKIEIYNQAAEKYLACHQPLQLSFIEKKNNEIFKIIHNIRPGHEILHKAKIDNLLQSILVKAAEFKFDSKIIKLVSFQDITSELDKKELDSWQKLIRVLTHEIMNSISPIISLSSVISGYFQKNEVGVPFLPQKIDQQIISKTLLGLNTIEETGKGLLEFVDKYRSLSSLPKPELSRFAINDLLLKCKLLMESDLSENIKISANTHPEDIGLLADYSQVEQVVINLIKNAIEAVSNKKNGLIQLKAFYSETATIIQVEDNGMGISNEIIENIFVPFYTTRENGSGIGLSLARQIMQNHNGSISVISSPDKGAIFTLKFQ